MNINKRLNIWLEQNINSKKAFFWLIVCGLAIYSRTLTWDYTYFDDNVLILENMFFLRNPSNFFRAFTTEVFHVLHSSAAYYRPILTVSYMIDTLISGGQAFFYHLSSIAVHLSVSCLILIFFRKIGMNKNSAFFLSMIFLVHPAITQATVWIPGRNDSLLTLFVLIGCIGLVDYFINGRYRYLFIHLLAFALGVFTKESGLLAIVIFVLMGILFKIKEPNNREKPKPDDFNNISNIRTGNGLFNRKIFFSNRLPLLITGWLLVLIVWFFLRSIALTGNPVSYQPEQIIKTVVENSPAILLFLGKALLPVNLSVLPTLTDSTLTYGLISLLLIVIFLFPLTKLRERKPEAGNNLFLLFLNSHSVRMIFFGITWYLLFLLPSFIRPNTFYPPDFLEHRQYLPLIGLLIVLNETFIIKSLYQPTHIKVLIASFVIFGFTLINIVYARNFSGRLVFWKNAVATSPNHPLAHKNLGAMYYLEDRLELAEDEFRKSLKLNSSEAMIHNNLGLIYFQQGDYSKAEKEYLDELANYPLYDNAYANLGLLYYIQGDKLRAEEMWIKTININPDHKDTLKNLSLLYFQNKNFDLARYYYEEAKKRGVNFQLVPR